MTISVNLDVDRDGITFGEVQRFARTAAALGKAPADPVLDAPPE